MCGRRRWDRVPTQRADPGILSAVAKDDRPARGRAERVPAGSASDPRAAVFAASCPPQTAGAAAGECGDDGLRLRAELRSGWPPPPRDQRIVVDAYLVSGTPNAAYMAWNAHTPRPNSVVMTAVEARPRSQARPGVLVTSQALSKEIAPSAGR